MEAGAQEIGVEEEFRKPVHEGCASVVLPREGSEKARVVAHGVSPTE